MKNSDMKDDLETIETEERSSKSYAKNYVARLSSGIRNIIVKIRDNMPRYSSAQYRFLAKENADLHRIVRYQESTSREVLGSLYLNTDMRQELYFLINTEFNKLEREFMEGKDITPRLNTLGDYARDFYRIHGIPERELLISLGSEGGTREVGDVRINLKDVSSVSEEVYVRQFISKAYPEMIMFTVSKGPFEFSRSFKNSQRLLNTVDGVDVKAPFDIVLKHVGQVLKLVKMRPALEYHKEQYEEKWIQNTNALSLRTRTIDTRTITAVSKIIPMYYDNASVPFWDRSLCDSRYNSDGEIKQFDFAKVRTLVIPGYELAQVALEYGEIDKVSVIKDIALENGVTELLWELGMLYGLNRQIHNSIIRRQDWKFRKFIKLGGNLEFRVLDAGKHIVEDIQKYSQTTADFS